MVRKASKTSKSKKATKRRTQKEVVNQLQQATPPIQQATPPIGPNGDRKLRILWQDEGGFYTILRMSNKNNVSINGETSANYLLRKLPYHTDDRIATYQITKLEREETHSFNVYLGAGNSADGCGCWSFKREKTCKHVQALLALQKASRL